MDYWAYLDSRTLSTGELVIWDTRNPGETAIHYTPPTDNMKRYYNSP